MSSGATSSVTSESSAPSRTLRLASGLACSTRTRKRLAIVALEQQLRLFGAQAALTLQILAEAARPDRDVTGEDRHAIVENVDVRDFMSDVDQPDDAVHGVRVIELECVMQREGVDVDDGRLEAGVGDQVHLRLDQIALGG